MKRSSKHDIEDIESSEQKHEEVKEDLIIFQGGEDLTICDILDAPGEVIGKSNYGTLYKALLQRSNKVRLKHPNLVPLLGFYTGPRGEKLLVHPFYRHGNLTQFIRASDLDLEVMLKLDLR
ncbi:hypothetical protein TSUD_364250 [Trifolium subterraneum]|uniref:Protein kinase domain-containing protein n=1 Tax=Trifolium subterraneum TaxID=3900 RepID=A0A2Z6LXW8_TRISU|nr:hypothetical protein TSUD_364250 [Trifolium subterraneum]